MVLDGCCVCSFCWEEAPRAPAGGARLLAVGAERHLKLLEVEAERGASASLRSLWEGSADQLLGAIREQDQGERQGQARPGPARPATASSSGLTSFLLPDVAQLHSLLLLSFAAGRCVLLLNSDWLLQLRWRPAEAELQATSCCSVGLSGGGRETAVDRCLCRDTLFTLHASGLICILTTAN